jgi:pyrimidine-nucleoside phosphorylase
MRDATATVSCIPLIAASIMSKKLALGSDGIVLDVKTGSGAFMKDEQDAIHLCQTMVSIGEKSGRPTLGIISNMDQPLGSAVGNSLEIIEAIEALKGKGPEDVMQVTYALGFCMLRVAGISMSYAQILEKFQKEISSGRALKIFANFISAQGGNPEVCENYDLLPASRQQVVFPALQSGYISRIDSLAIGMAAIDIGAGRRLKDDAIDHGSGFVFQAKVGDKVKKGQPLATIHCDHTAQIQSVRERLQGAIQFSQKPIAKPKMILQIIDKDGVHPWPY